MNKGKKIAGLYIRVSAEDQAIEGFSLTEQENGIMDVWMKMNILVLLIKKIKIVTILKDNYDM